MFIANCILVGFYILGVIVVAGLITTIGMKYDQIKVDEMKADLAEIKRNLSYIRVDKRIDDIFDRKDAKCDAFISQANKVIKMCDEIIVKIDKEKGNE